MTLISRYQIPRMNVYILPEFRYGDKEMAAVIPLYDSLEIDLDGLGSQQRAFIDTVLFFDLCEKMQNRILAGYKTYFNAIKQNAEKEKIMLEENIMSCILNDILSTKEYTLAGVAYYTDTPEEILLDLSAGVNSNPTFSLSRRLMDLHRMVKPQLYSVLLNPLDT